MRARTTCPAERFPTLYDAATTAVERRTRAALAGSPRDNLQAWPCDRCDGAHITRTEHLRAAA